MTARRFILVRHDGISGVGSTGAVADGVQWPDGTIAVRWRGQPASTTVWPHGLAELLAHYGEGGSASVEWIDNIDDVDPEVEYHDGAIWVH
jgi:hypothetical protein